MYRAGQPCQLYSLNSFVRYVHGRGPPRYASISIRSYRPPDHPRRFSDITRAAPRDPSFAAIVTRFHLLPPERAPPILD
jgi:hypothetical protein